MIVIVVAAVANDRPHAAGSILHFLWSSAGTRRTVANRECARKPLFATSTTSNHPWPLHFIVTGLVRLRRRQTCAWPRNSGVARGNRRGDAHI